MKGYFMLLVAGVNQDLFSSEWTEGNLYSIQPVVSKVGDWSCRIISFVGFMIVIASILKNAISGLYVVNPNLWDKVDQIKKAAGDSVSNFGNGTDGRFGAAAKKVGGFLSFAIGLLPNVKELTDFEDNEIDKKQYFMKSIPLLVAQIFIGMMIFFGYPAKIANWIGAGGTQMLSGIINNVDPVTVVQGISQKFSVVNLQTDGSSDPVDRVVNQMALDAVNLLQGNYSDMAEQPRQNCASEIEVQMLNILHEQKADTMLRADGFKANARVTWATTTPVVSNSFQALPVEGTNQILYMSMATNGLYTFKFWINATALPSGSTKVKESDYLVCQVDLTPVALTATSTSTLVAIGGVNTTGIQRQVSGVRSVTYSTNIESGTGQNMLNMSLGKALTATLYDSTGSSISSYTITFSTPSSGSSNGRLQMSLGAGDMSRFAEDINSSNFSYISINIGDATISAEYNQKEVTSRVSEIRLYAGESHASGYVNSLDATNLNAGTPAATIGDAIGYQGSSGQ